MIAEIGKELGSKALGTAVDSDIQTVMVTVAGNPPTFTFDPHDVEINQPEVTVALTLQPAGVTFAPFGANEPGPIIWRKPGTKEQVARPSYIGPPTLDDSWTTLSFDITNTATPGTKVLISYTIRVSVDGGPIIESPDPTIINVDPT